MVKIAKWWNENMADAGQIMYGDPSTALEVATMPNDVVFQPGSEVADEVEFARQMKGNFLQKAAATMGFVNKNTDKIMSDVPGFGVAKNVASGILWPVDKLASGAYWLYSNAVSQPLSTAIIQAGKAQTTGDYGQLVSGEEWSEAYGKAEHLSPGQAIFNLGFTQMSQGQIPFTAIDRPDPDLARQNERLLYDTEYWRNKIGWGYTAGTGASDFAFNIALDPLVPAAKGVGKGIQLARHAEATSKAASTSERLNEFFDWAAAPGPSGARKSAYEIEQHPIWGTGRRKNPEAARLSEVYSTLTRNEMPLIGRFASGQSIAVPNVQAITNDTLAQIGRVNDNRVLVDSTKFDDELLSYFLKEERAGRTSPGSARPGIGGQSSAYVDNQIVEPPYPRPEQPGPRQSGWDAAYGHLAEKGKLYREAAGELLKAGPRGTGPASYAVNAQDLAAVEQWRAGKLDTLNEQLLELQKREKALMDLTGPNWGRSIEEFAPGSSNLFGSMKQLYRLGPMGGSVAKMGDKAIMKAGVGRGNYAKQGGIAEQVYRNGFYRPGIRFIQTFGETMPEQFINHVADDATQRVMDMLKQVKGMTPETRLGLVNLYSSAGDKVARSKALNDIHGAVIRHYGKTQGLHPEVVDLIHQMTRDGLSSTMNNLTGMRPTAQQFSTAQVGGVRADMVESGEGLVVAPTAKTQLSQGEALLPVREFERFIERNSGALRNYKPGLGSAADWMVGHVDNLSKVWKAFTLLRPGYTVRTVSEEAAAAAVKFGILSSMVGAGRGGANFARNRVQQTKAFIGKGSYTSTVEPGKSRVLIEAPEAQLAAERHGLEVANVKLGDAWPIVYSRIETERSAIKSLEAEVAELKKVGEDVSAQEAQIAEHRTVIDEFNDYAEEMLRQAEIGKGRRLGEGTIEYRGIKVPEVFSREWDNPISRDQVNHERAVDFLFARSEAVDNNRLIKTGDWTTITNDMPNHMESWLRALNLQFRQDEVYKLVAKDPTLKEASAYLRTPEGKMHLSSLGPWGAEPERLLKSVQATLDKYLPRGTGLQTKIAAGEEIAEHELRGAMAAEDFPAVHGEEIKAFTKRFSKETTEHKTNQIIKKGYALLGGIPSDLLVRHPTFNKMYIARMQDNIDQHIKYRTEVGGDLSITAKEMNEMYEIAANQAKKDISQVVYDPTRTTATEALRFVAPFLSAHVDSLQRWSGLIAEKPQLLAGISKIYNAPVAANLITDVNGNHVGQDGYATITDPVTGQVIERKFVNINDRVLHIRLPWDTEKINGREVPGGSIPIKIQALNTILPGDPWFSPGTGPLVQMPASAIAKQSPQVGEFLQWAKVLPYGPNENFYDAYTPKYMKAAWDAWNTEDPDNERYQQAWLAAYNRQAGDLAAGRRKSPVNLKQVDQEAKQFMYMQFLTAWGSPAQTRETPLTGTPYQFFVDQYKKLQEINPKTADDRFLATYGEDYFSFTASLSKSIGVAPSIAAMTTSEEYRDLIDKDPEMASFIVGQTYNGGTFSSSVYRKQMETLMGGKPMREKVSGLEAIRQAETTQGWAYYMKYKGKLDAALYANGFRSYSDPGAEAFAQMKNDLILDLESSYPQWAKERGQIDTQKIPSRIKFFEKAVSDSRLQSDPMRRDLPAVDMYLRGRQQFKQELERRGLKKLSFDYTGKPTGQAQDLGYAWRQFQSGLVASNTQFQDVFNRYLEGDDLQ